jgi:sodium transport system permease protein
VLIGAPSALVSGLGVAQLFQRFVPVPERMLEEFDQLLLASGIPFWQLLLMIAVVPGICEELAFRGVLLHGLSKRLPPVALALVVGAIFGLFHVSLWRILSTAYLGAVLAAVVTLTGSIFPAMLWHALNNATVVVAAELGWMPEGFRLPLWSYPLAVSGLALTFVILWTTRRPYPGLRSSPAAATASRSGGRARPLP